MNQINVKPITLFQSSWYFIISSLMIYFGLYKAIPILLDNGYSFVTGYFIFFYTPFILLFITALVLYRKEGHCWKWSSFKNRMRLNPMTTKDWWFVVGLIVFALASSLALEPIAKWMAQIPLLAPPDFFPAEINPNKISLPGYMMDYQLSGQYWVIVVYFIGWIFNILGEEFLWRGIILPRQEKVYGKSLWKKTWIYHGFMWGLWHFFWKWNVITLIPFTLALTFVVSKRQNTWIGIITHGIINLIPLLIIINEVLK